MASRVDDGGQEAHAGVRRAERRPGGSGPGSARSAWIRGGLVAVLLALVVGGAASAQTEPAPEPEASPIFVPEEDPGGDADSMSEADVEEPDEDRPPWFRRPAGVMVRSLVFPGWGQLTNRKYWKAAVVAGVEGFLILRAVEAGLDERDAKDLADAATTEELKSFYEARAETFNERRRDYTWWTIFAVILSMGDAYVDAHLGNFEVEFEPLESSAGHPTGYRAGLRWNIGR